jgi:hypothetical protein
MMSNLEDRRKLIAIAEKTCSKYGVLCLPSEGEVEERVLSNLVWLESLYYVDPASCIKSQSCLENLVLMYLETAKLALEGLYTPNIDDDMIEEAARKLASIKPSKLIMMEG